MALTKQCTKCKLVKELPDFPKKKSESKDGFCSWCKSCHSNKRKNWIDKNRIHFNETRKKWKKLNPEKEIEYRKKSKESLSDVYIKSLITHQFNISFSMIPQDLVEIKRLHLKTKRLLK